MALLYTVVSPFEGEGGGAGHAGGSCVRGTLVHYCTRVGFVHRCEVLRLSRCSVVPNHTNISISRFKSGLALSLD